VDTDGLVLRAVVLAPHWQDRAGAMGLCLVAKPDCARLALLRADGAYAGMEAWMAKRYGWQLQTVSKPPGQKGFHLLPRPWVAERTFAWLGRSRRLSKDYEKFAETSEAWIDAASIRWMLRRLVA
jgi:putative transposase